MSRNYRKTKKYDTTDLIKWIEDDGFGDGQNHLRARNELKRIKNSFLKFLHHTPSEETKLSMFETYKIIRYFQLRIVKLRHMVDHKVMWTGNINKPTGVKYVVARCLWYDNDFNKVKKFSSNLGNESKVLINGKIPHSLNIKMEEHMNDVMWKEYEKEYGNDKIGDFL